MRELAIPAGRLRLVSALALWYRMQFFRRAERQGTVESAPAYCVEEGRWISTGNPAGKRHGRGGFLPAPGFHPDRGYTALCALLLPTGKSTFSLSLEQGAFQWRRHLLRG